MSDASHTFIQRWTIDRLLHSIRIMSFSGRQHLQCLAHKIRLWSSDRPRLHLALRCSRPASVTTNETLFEMCTFVPNLGRKSLSCRPSFVSVLDCPVCLP